MTRTESTNPRDNGRQSCSAPRRIGVTAMVATGLLWLAVPSAAQVDFDHWATSFPLTGAHARTACDTCHPAGEFAGAPSTCAGCHRGAGSKAVTAKPPNHVPSSNQCDDCHTVVSWSNARFDHTEVVDSCTSCHTGFWAEGKGPSHLPTSNRCEDCHNTYRFSRARMNHLGISAGCSQCHDGSRASGKSRSHLPTSNRCEDCHSTARFRPARMNHVGIATGCYSCHNNQLVAGKHPTHIPSPNNCELCHNTTSWK